MSDIIQQGVNGMIAHINKNGFVRPYLYQVLISGEQNLVKMPDRSILYNCQAISIPGINIAVFSDARYGIGLSERWGDMKAFTELTMTFYESENQQERKFFADWIDSIYDRETKRINYKKDYIKDITIYQYNRQGDKTYECKLTDCFPSSVSPLERSYNSTDSVSQFSVSFQFTEMKETFLK